MIDGLRTRVFYGWFMVAAGFGVQLLVGGLLNQAYGAYVVLLREQFGWSKTALSAAFSLARFESGLFGPIEGWLIDRFGPRTVMRFGFVIFGGGFMLFSQVNSLTTFYIAFIFMAAGSSLSGFMPLTVAIVNWFRRRRATALAVMQIGFAVGGLTVPLVVISLETLGWRGTAFASGVLVLVAGLPLSQIIRHRPEDYGLTVDGHVAATVTPAGDDGRAAFAEAEPIDFSPREALRTPSFWLISFGHGSALLVVSAVMVHLVSHLNENLGYSLSSAALVVTLMTSMQIAGQIGGGFLGDRFNKRLIAACCMGRAHDRPAAGRPRDWAVDGRRVRRPARLRLGRPRPADAGDPGRLLRPRFLRRDHGPLLDDHHVRQRGRTTPGRDPGGQNGQLRDGLHRPGRPRWARLDLLPAGEETTAAAPPGAGGRGPEGAFGERVGGVDPAPALRRAGPARRYKPLDPTG